MSLFSKHAEKIYIIKPKWLTERLLCQLVNLSGTMGHKQAQLSK